MKNTIELTELQIQIIEKGLWDLRDYLLNRSIFLMHNHDPKNHDWCIRQVDIWDKTVDEIDNIINNLH